jgi:hypothetical protein
LGGGGLLVLPLPSYHESDSADSSLCGHVSPSGLSGGPDTDAEEAAQASKRQRLEAEAGAEEVGDGEVPRVACEGAAACYIIRLAAIPGKFMPEKVRAAQGNAGCQTVPLSSQALHLLDGQARRRRETGLSRCGPPPIRQTDAAGMLGFESTPRSPQVQGSSKGLRRRRGLGVSALD